MYMKIFLWRFDSRWEENNSPLDTHSELLSMQVWVLKNMGVHRDERR
jgi:hypothetical protein